MKTIQNIDYVSLAVSKDKARPALNSVYRDTHCFVGTDGYRLHLTNGLDEAKPHFVNGQTDDQFPDYKQVLPENYTDCFTADNWGKDLLAKLKAFTAFVKQFDKATCRVSLLISQNLASITLDHSDSIASTTLLEGERKGEEYKASFNCRYLLDALQGLQLEKIDSVKLHYDNKKALTPLKISFLNYSGKKIGLAVLMPLKD